MKSSRLLTVHVWCPAYAHKDGGIQQFSRLLVQGVGNSPLVEDCSSITFSSGSKGRVLFLAHAVLRLFFRPDLIIITHLHLARLSPLLRILRIPYWICAHGIECWDSLSPKDLASLSGASCILCVSRYTRDRLKKNAPEKSLATALFPNHIELPPPLPVSKEEARRQLGLSWEQTTFVILTVSRLASSEKYKGHRLMLEALALLKKQGETNHYLIAGEGDDKAALEKRAEDLGLNDQVSFLGRVDDQTLELAYAACDAFAMPSTGEGFGIVYLEALARGRPVLAGNRDGSTDPLKDGALGVLVDPLSLDSLVEGLQKLKVDARKSEPEELKAAVLQEFSFHQLQQRLNTLLQSFISNPSCAE